MRFLTLIILFFSVVIIAEGQPLNHAQLLYHSKLYDDDVQIMKDDIYESLVENEYIIEFDSNITDVEATVRNLTRRTGGTIQYVYTEVFKGAAIANISNFGMTKLLNSSKVTRASRNLKLSSHQVTTEEDATWGIDRLVPPLDSKYSYKYDGSNVTAYVLDTGIYIEHEEFEGRASCGKSYYDDNCDDIIGHGTHVAGTIGGKVYGIAKNVNLVSVKVLGDDGEGSDATVIAGIDWVVKQKKLLKKPMVINMSLGGPKSQHINKATNAAVTAGIVTVVAAGNDSADACTKSPASAGYAITVGATSIDDSRAYFSNYGKCVDILAPGEDIESAYSLYGLFGTTWIMSGTSMASPHVAGVAALYLQRSPRIRAMDVATAMKRRAQKNLIKYPPMYDENFNPVFDVTPNLFLTASNLLV